MSTLILSPEVLSWAAQKSGSPIDAIAHKISKRNYEKIIDGKLTLAQAKKFSQLTHVPFGYLFLEEPPETPKLPIADFRTVSGSDPLSQDFLDVFYDIQRKQAWYRDYLVSNSNEEISFVGKFRGKNSSVENIAKDIRNVLKIADNPSRNKISDEEYFSLLSSKVEAAGILVFKSGIVGSNTHRGLSVGEFRGFVITDAYAPAIFINGKDSPAANTFTLMHEVAHIWLGQSGISDTSAESRNKDERTCNAIAAEVLIPQLLFIPAWNESEGSLENKISFLSGKFNVSKLVIARRALDSALIKHDLYKKISDATYTFYRNKLEKTEGGNPFNSFPIKNSRKLSRLMTEMAATGSITLREASYVLNASPRFIVKYHEQQH